MGNTVTVFGEDFLARHCTLMVKILGAPKERGPNFRPPP